MKTIIFCFLLFAGCSSFPQVKTVIYVSEGWPDTTRQVVTRFDNGIRIGSDVYLEDTTKTDDPYLMDPINETVYSYGWNEDQTRLELVSYDEQIYIVW